MGPKKLELFCLFLCIGISQCAFFFAPGHKWEYDYTAKAKAGTKLPEKASTGMTYHGKLIVEAFPDHQVVMKLENMEYSYYNRDKTQAKGNGEPLPEATKVLEKPFVVQYINGMVKNILVAPEEPDWAVNMKKAIAGVFQIDQDAFTHKAILAKESNIYGKCGVEYSVRNVTNHFEIMKNIKMETCVGSNKIYTTTKKSLCDVDTPSVASAKRFYVLGGFEHPVIENITSRSERFANAFNHEEGSFRIFSKQKFILLNEAKLPKDHEVPKTCTEKKDVVYDQIENFDYSQGREAFTQEDIIEGIKKAAAKTMKRFNDKFTFDTDILHENGMQMMYWMMLPLTEKSFDKIYEDFKQDDCEHESKRKLFLEMLPFVGSHDSVIFINKLITSGEIPWMNSLKMLMIYPFHVKHITKKMIDEIKWIKIADNKYKDHIQELLRDTALLSYSNLIYRAYTEFQLTTEEYMEYYDWFAKHYDSCTTHESKMIAVQALRNLQEGPVFEKLLSVLDDDKNCRHLKLHAMTGLIPKVHTKKELVYKYFWPMFIDRNEHMEMRNLAMRLLMAAEPTATRFFSIYWYIKSEKSMVLKSTFVSLIKDLHQLTYACYEDLSKMAKKFLPYIEDIPVTSNKLMMYSFIFDYINFDSDVSTFTNFVALTEEESNWPLLTYLSTTKTGFGQVIGQTAIFVKTAGLHTTFDIVNGTSEESYNVRKAIGKVLEDNHLILKTPEPLHVEVFLEVHNKVVFSRYWDYDSIMKEFHPTTYTPEVSKCGYKMYSKGAVFPMAMSFFGSTDFGTFMYMGYMKNGVSETKYDNTKFEESKEDSNLGHKDFKTEYEFMDFMDQRLEFFNPIVNVYQGIEKLKSGETGIASNFQLVYEGDKVTKVKFMNSNGNNGMVMHQYTGTYITTWKDWLSDTKSKFYSDLSLYHGKEPAEKKEYKFPIKDLGIKLVFTMFECENYEDIYDVLFNIFEEAVDFMADIDSEQKAMVLYNYLTKINDKINFQISHENCGFGLQILPLFEEPSVFEITYKTANLKLRQNEKDGYISGSVYKVKQPEKIYFTWNMTVDVVSDFGLTKLVNWKFTKKDWNVEKPVGTCFDYTMDYDSDFKHPQADYYNLEPIKSSSMKFNLRWGQSKSTDVCPESHSINYIYKGSNSEEQIQASKSMDKWPFKQCKENLKGHKFTPATEACYRSAVEMSTYRKYDSYITMKDVPDWLEKGIEIMTSVVNYIPVLPHIHPQFDHGSTKIKFTEIMPMDDEEDSINFIYGNETQNVVYSISSFDPQINPKVFRADSGFLSKIGGVCVVSPNVVRTYDNYTITDYDNTKQYILLTDCYKYPTYYIYMSKSDTGSTIYHFVLMTHKIDVEVTTEGTIHIKEDGTEIDLSQDYQGVFDISKYHNGYHISSFDKMSADVTVRPDFIVISSYADYTCGMCNLGKHDYMDYVKTV